MPRKRGDVSSARDQAHRRVANSVPAPLIAHPNAEHARLFAKFLGALPGDQRDHPGARALASTAATLTAQIHRVAAALEARGDVPASAVGDPRNADLVKLSGALVRTLRAMRALPSGDKRAIASGAALEREARGNRDLAPPPGTEAIPVPIDYVKLLAEERRR